MNKTIRIHYAHSEKAVCEYFFDTIEETEAAYKKITAALDEYGDFKNNGVGCVNIKSREGLSTLSVKNINAVTLFDPNEARKVSLEAHIEESKWMEELKNNISEEYFSKLLPR
jgi:hypothetical protein